MLATASVIAIVFFIIYAVVETAVYGKLDQDLVFEAQKHTKEIYIKENGHLFFDKYEWLENEHREVQVNPVFIQLVNNEGVLMDKSPNLKEHFLEFHQNKAVEVQFDTKLNNQVIRQIQVPIEHNSIRKGYILAAMSLEGAITVLESLKRNLLMLFPMVLLGLFFITRFLAGKSIIPVKIITETADRITKHSLNERIPLPNKKDELFTLTSSINELLNRMEDAMEREKQFTADASHQLRTPLSVLKGTLEVLIRKTRKEEEYKEKIAYSIQEINRLSEVVDQLLVLARFDKSNHNLVKTPINLQITIDDILQRFRSTILAKNLSVDVKVNPVGAVISDPYYMDMIFDNIFSNAIKYSNDHGAIEIAVFPKKNTVICQVQDHGIGINSVDIEHIFNPFFRSDALEHKAIKGNGLGLSIVKKACDLLSIGINVSSELNKGTSVSLSFPVA